MKLSLTGTDTYTLTSPVVDKLIRAGDGDAALLYLYILRTKGQSTDKQAGEALKWNSGKIATASTVLSRMGLIGIDDESSSPEAGSGGRTGTKPAGTVTRSGCVRGSTCGDAGSGGADPAATGDIPAEPKTYTEEEVVAEIAAGSDFSLIVDEVTRRLGRILTSPDLLRLFSLYENLHLPKEVIIQLVTHCITECRRKDAGQMPSIAYIEKAAYTWEREGIFSIDKAEEYLKRLEQRRSMLGKVKQVLQIRDREFAPTEKQYVETWINMGFDLDSIAHAYDKTVLKTGGLKYEYMDTILHSWDSKGLHTIEQVKGKDSPGSGHSGYGTRGGAGKSGHKHGVPTREQADMVNRLIEEMDCKK